MFVEKRPVQGKIKYYLVHSYRRGSKTKKLRVYLGVNLSEKGLKAKRAEAEKKILERIDRTRIIHDPYRTVLSNAELSEIELLEPKGKIKLIHLSEEEWLKFTEAFTYDTNAIEGSTIGKAEVRQILEKDKWPNKSKEEISETFGVANAVKYVRKTKTHISIPLILDLHKLVFRNSKSFAGKFRKIGEEVAIVDSVGNVVHRGAFSGKVPSLLKELVQWYKKNGNRYPPVVLAAVVHNQFETIHPFRDGNGRVGRLLLINILLKHRMPPVNIELKNRREYYDALQAYQKNGNIGPTVELLLKEYKRLKSFLNR